jgi:nucleotide-binding universal stress UspA family protein
MYTKILVALDGSPLSEGILSYVRFFAEMLEIPAELLHVIDPETLMPLAGGKRGPYKDVLTAEKKSSSEYLRKLTTLFRDSSRVDCTVEVGKPAEIIVDRAAAQPGALIAMATHGRSGVKRWLLGSVAEKVLQAAANHLLLVRTVEPTKGSETMLLRRVMVPLDGSELAETAIPHAVELARKMNFDIVLVRASALPTPFYGGEEYGADIGEIWELLKKDAREYLDEKVRLLQQEGLGRISTALLEGDAAGTIIDLARESPKSLIVMCTHGRTGVGRWVLGSVADRVVRHSDDPVLLIRAARTV